MQSYRDRVENYVRKNKDHLVIYKLRTNEPITKGEIQLLEKLLFEGDLGTKAITKKNMLLSHSEFLFAHCWVRYSGSQSTVC
jgi:type I site-specific restriction endonuclease